MADTPTATLEQHFGHLTDPRVERTRAHELVDIVIIAICAVICGADSWVEVEAFGRVFARLDPEEFAQRFINWVQAVSAVTQGQVIAVDGKTVRRSYDKVLGKGALHLVSAWASAHHLVLGQRQVEEKSNEITAIPALLQVLDVSGCIVTIDAMGCQKDIAQQIVAQGGEYVLALKDNQEHLHQDVQALFAWAQKLDFVGRQHDYDQVVNQGHGRIEKRERWTLSDPACLQMLPDRGAWENRQTVVKIRAQRQLGEQTEVEERYDISSLSSNRPGSAGRMLETVRTHWEMENQVHWVLDIAFRQDDSRIRIGQAPENFAVLRRIALNLLPAEKTVKLGTKAQRLKAAWSEDYLLKLLSH
jgi:predicted transposase YbfD/YdcC